MGQPSIVSFRGAAAAVKGSGRVVVVGVLVGVVGWLVF